MSSAAWTDGRGGGPSLAPAEALDSPTVPVARIENADRGGNRSESFDERAQKSMEAVPSAEEDAAASRSREGEKLPLSNNRKQWQKQRQRQRQKQQQQPTWPNDTAEQGGENDVQPHRHQPQQPSSQAEYDAYMHWCHKVLGISSVVEIRDFEYLDHLQMLWDENDAPENEEFDWLEQYSAANDGQNDGDGDGIGGSTMELPTKTVRGLAATHDIQVGDVVISVPLYSLLSVPTTIDHDPVLSRILGPDAREGYGWTDASEYEVPLLVLAVLYHRSLGSDSPLSHYIDILLGTPVDAFPFLWTDRELRERTGGDAGEGVRGMARGIRSDLREMYDGVMGTLVKERPEWFEPPGGPTGGGAEEGGGAGWAYSYENFRWAFALVISRHHYLPIQDFDEGDAGVPRGRPSVRSADAPSSQAQDPGQIMHETLSSVSEVVPPANQPTDSWVDLAVNEERVTEDDYLVAADDDDDDATAPQSAATRHSFLAPLADLINFGPPCLTGGYNADDRAFDLVATCPFSRGQEVTFWYSSDCGDVIAASFGFLHPLVPPCPRPEDERKREEEERREEAALRETELWEAYRRMDLLKEEMAALESQLVSCECEDGERKGKGTESAEGAAAPAGAGPKVRIRGRINEPVRPNEEMMEELG